MSKEPEKKIIFLNGPYHNQRTYVRRSITSMSAIYAIIPDGEPGAYNSHENLTALRPTRGEYIEVGMIDIPKEGPHSVFMWPANQTI